MRLDKFVANNTSLSRNEAKRAAKNGELLVNGIATRDMAYQLQPDDLVELFGQRVQSFEPLYLMLHKPAGCVCANEEGQNPTVIDVLYQAADAQGDRPMLARLASNQSIQMVGRLDLDTTGLLFITSDGQWNHRVSAPGGKFGKTYRVTLAEPITPAALKALEQGVVLNDSPTPTAPAQVEVISERVILLTIFEGRYHQVKRMLASVDNQVTALHRERIGPTRLDPELQPGDYRPLTPSEINQYL
ncbi:pseudouridine synthase [Halioxenophilus sp. WMMB6]|uniref:pseudouridine synthase n=1 Tax=Halioxenophilus sp. WMMB6 TaxID=3073815 RepID=UPI00295E6F31|nr:pseudouridine synthase [Halioxenophilus sp. WMMB6]